MPTPTFEQLTAVRALGEARYAPDGRRFAYLANTSGRSQLWMQPAGGGFPVQLTALESRRVTSFAWSRDGRRIAFLADLHGDEMHQVFVIDVREDGAGWPRQLTDRPDVQYELGDWTPDGRIVVSGNDRDPSEVDPQLLDPETGEVRRLMTGGRHYGAFVSPDGAFLTVIEVRSNTDQDVHVLELATGGSRCVTGHEGEATFRPGPWARDGSGFYLLTDHGREFDGLAFWSREGDAWRWSHAPERDVDDFHLSLDGRTTATVENDGGASAIRVYDLERGTPLNDPELPSGVIASLDLHPTERRALIAFATPREAANLFEIDLRTGAMERREQSMLGGVDVASLALPEAVRYESFDREIPAWLYRPEGEGPHPVVLSIHGGPESQERPNYAYLGLYQYLVTRGIAVLAPNIRGSTGYGKSYQKLIHRDWGGDELRDVEAAADHLAADPAFDSERIGIFGGSFGGFATLSAVTRLPDRWSVAVDVVGPSNLVTFVKSVPPHWRPMMRAWVGDPEEDREMLLERSPITYVDRVRVPLLVYQGANDPRVVKAESDQMVEALRANGLEVDYHVDEEGGHGPADREASVVWFRTIAEYLVRHLAPDGG